MIEHDVSGPDSPQAPSRPAADRGVAQLAPAHPEASVRAIPGRLLAGLNPEQHEAVSSLTGPLLVVAGPGSGKTRVLVHRVAALVATGTAPAQILAVTFTNKAAAEMRERVSALIGPPAERMWIATFHSACVRILRQNHEAAGLPRSFSIADSADAARLLTVVMKDAGLLRGLNPAEAKQEVRSTHSRISRHKNAGAHPQDLLSSADPDTQQLGTVMASYNNALARIGAVDFDDILLRTRDLLRSDAQVRGRYQERFTHLLVDEYQDTNAVQYDIVRLLAPTRRSNVCVVGDADQSIYAFRGADPSVLTAFTGDYDATVVLLAQNYRSSGAIVEVAQAIIEPNPAAHRARLRTENPRGAAVRVHECESGYSEARHIVDLIQQRGGDLAEHAVLVRTNALTRALEQELTERRVRYQVVGALRFYDRAEVKDALAHLRLAMNPADEVAFERAVTTPRRGIGEATVLALRDEARAAGVDIISAARERSTASSAAARKLSAFLDVHAQVRAAAEQGPCAALRVIADAAGLRAHLQATAARDGLDREANLDELLDYARTFTGDRAATDPEGRLVAQLPGWEQTAAFLENVALVSAAETPTGEDPGTEATVAVLTMHAAKGQEFDHVYVMGLEENVCPHARSLKSGLPSDLQEERRLMFVAVSRARTTLDLTYCQRRSAFGQDQFNAPSRFLDALPPEVQRTSFLTRPAGRSATGSPRVRPVSSTRHASPGGPARVRPPAGRATLTMAQLTGGTRVRHTVFGDGAVVATAQETVTVDFGSPIGRKTLLVAIAPLSLL